MMRWLNPSQRHNNMSCGCCTTPCTCNACDATNESTASTLNNFITAFFGSVTKTCVNGEVQWVLPCDLDAGISGFPRLADEGIACYLMRIFGTLTSGYDGTVTLCTNVDFTSPNFTKTLQSFTFQNGSLVSVGTPVTTTVFTGEACP